MESLNSTTNNEQNKKQHHHSKNSKKTKELSFLRKLFGKPCHQNDSASSSGSSDNNQKRGSLKTFFKKKKLADNSTQEFKLLHLQTISSSRTLKQDGNDSQIKPFLVSDHNSTQTSTHVLEMGSKARHKPFTVLRSDKETIKLIRSEDVPPITRSIHADIGRENAENNSIATQQTHQLIHRETDTSLFKRYYQDRGMQSEESHAPSEETIMPKSSTDSNEMEDDEDSLHSSSSEVLAPKNSNNVMKTPEAGDKATPEVEKSEENQPETPITNTSQALVPFKEDTLWILLHARSKLMTYLDDDKVDKVLDDQQLVDLLPDEEGDEARRKVRSEAFTKKLTDDAKADTYKTMQNDIKEMITDLLLQSSEIKGEALSAGVLEDDSPPFICDFLDSYYSSAAADVSYILDCVLQRVEEKIDKPVGIGDADDVKSTLRPFLIPTGKKNITETYFCTTTFDRIPKTSWIFGDTRTKSKYSSEKTKKDLLENDILLENLEGCCDLLSGLFDPQDQFVCMLHNGNMRKSEKHFDLRSGISQCKTKTTTTTAKRNSTEDEKLLSSTYPSSQSSSSLLQDKASDASTKPSNKTMFQATSSSDDSLIKSKVKRSKTNKGAVRKMSELSGYESDQETGVEESSGKVMDKSKTKKIKSKQEMNSPEEIRKIEENVAQNKMLKAKKEKETDGCPKKK